VPKTPAAGARDVREAAAHYISLGWYPIPLEPGAKACKDSDWLERVYVPEEFEPEDNLGLRLVSASDPRALKLVGLDLDAAEAVDVAEDLLPPTGAAWGRPGKKVSQALYVSPLEKTVVFKDLVTGGTVLEIRVQHQSMAPPSVHPNGERLSWIGGPLPGTPTTLDPDALYRHAQLLATAAVVGRYYNEPGARHEWGLALAGLFVQLELEEAEALSVMRSAGSRVARDPELKDRLEAIRTTYAKAQHAPLKAGKGLAELAKGGKEFVATVRRIWGGTTRGDFVRDEKDRIVKDSQENVRRAIQKEQVNLSYDRFSDQPFLANGDAQKRMLDDESVDRLWLAIDEHHGFRASYDFFYKVVMDTAAQNSFHPVLEYLKDLKWDGVPRVDRWLVDYAHAADTEYVRAVGRLFLVAAVKRVRHPGCKFDEMVILEGTQGTGKSTMLQNLCPDGDWFLDELPLDLETKELLERTGGKWIIEAGELSGIRKAQVEHLKGLLSRQVDGPVRMAYARRPIKRKRQFVIIGSTNSFTYLKDATGNRRFWPVMTANPDAEGVAKVRDQLWAEAAQLEAAGEPVRLARNLWEVARLQQERRRSEDPWENALSLAFPRDEKQRVTSDEVWDKLGIPIALRGERENERVVAVMQRLGYRKMSVRNRAGKVEKGWGREAADLGDQLVIE
jgi:predicted P-loop ATPase